jgi:uncharacterized SAM-binding protein YcdF (DUF218 family)
MATEFPASMRVASRARRRLARFAFVLLALGGISTVVWLYPTFFLREAVDLWTVSDEVAPADAVAVFGGGVVTRPFAAAAYYRDGLVPKVLISNNPSQPLTAEILYSETESNRQVLLKQGVPADAIELFGADLTSTYQETIALRAWALRNHARTLIVPTEYFSSRRVHWILNREFFGTGVHVLVPALDDPQYPRREWWKDGKAILNFQNEIVKYIYYRLVF